MVKIQLSEFYELVNADLAAKAAFFGEKSAHEIHSHDIIKKYSEKYNLTFEEVSKLSQVWSEPFLEALRVTEKYGISLMENTTEILK